MKRLYAPWREAYATGVLHKGLKNDGSAQECVFCQQFAAQDDDKHFIIKRFVHCAVIMNSYPYNNGHLMILPYQHVSSMTLLQSNERAEIMEVLSQTEQIIETTLKPQGFNIGINLGIAGGGGIPSHLHLHILPRWKGDTNFLETIGSTKLISTDFINTFEKLKKAFQT